MSQLGFGGRTLKLIKSMYCNDSLRFLINGKYSAPLWITQGVKQGMSIEGKEKTINFDKIL